MGLKKAKYITIKAIILNAKTITILFDVDIFFFDKFNVPLKDKIIIKLQFEQVLF